MGIKRRDRSLAWGRMGCLVCLTTIAMTVSADPAALSVSGSLTSSTIGNVGVGAGVYTPEQLSAVGGAVGSVGSDGFTGVPVWGLLGGNSAGTSSDVVTDSAKNAILRSYLLATNTRGAQFVISLGEVDPFFGAAASSPFVSFAGGDGNPALIFPGQGASGRNINDLASLQVFSVGAPSAGPGGVSNSLLLSGNVSSPGVYSLDTLKNLPATTETVSGDTYTGVNLWNFLAAGTTNEFDQYVLAEGTDGYEVLFSLAELDPALGAPNDLVPYADTAGQFPADGVARIVIPGDNHAGRYVSNLSVLEVDSVPEPSTMLLLGCGLSVIAIVRRTFVRRRPIC